MTWTYTDEYYKNYTRDTWNESAPAYAPLAGILDQFSPILLKHLAPRPGERILDVATGPGEPALTIAPHVAPDGGHVLGIDLAQRMIDHARENAKARGIDNAEFRVMDAEKLMLADESFDAVVCRFGLQIVTDPDAAAREALRVLKPGGRLVATVWGPAEACPAIHVIIGPMLEHAEPDETGYLPTPYEMGGRGELVEILRRLGFRDAREERTLGHWRFPDEEAYFHAVLKGSPIGHSLSEEDVDVQREVLEKTHANLQKWKTPEGIVIPSECVVVSARK